MCGGNFCNLFLPASREREPEGQLKHALILLVVFLVLVVAVTSAFWALCHCLRRRRRRTEQLDTLSSHSVILHTAWPPDWLAVTNERVGRTAASQLEVNQLPSRFPSMTEYMFSPSEPSMTRSCMCLWTPFISTSSLI